MGWGALGRDSLLPSCVWEGTCPGGGGLPPGMLSGQLWCRRTCMASTSGLPGLLPSPSSRRICVLVQTLSGAGLEHLKFPRNRQDAGWLRGKGQQLCSCPRIVLPSQSLSAAIWIPLPARRVITNSCGEPASEMAQVLFPICSSPSAGRLPALCHEYKASAGTCPQWARELSPASCPFWPLATLTTH